MASVNLFVLGHQVLSIDIQRGKHYVAAVYEHHAILNPNPAAIIDRHTALQLMKRNLDIYEEQVINAAKQVEY